MLLASAEAAPPPADAPLAEPSPQPHQTLPHWARFGVALAEGTALDFWFLTFSNLVSREPFARISGATIAAHLQPSSWTLDGDYYLTNQFGHPYQGALHFTAARSAGLGFWTSAVLTSLESLAWELFFEVDPPSLNDQITTSLGGAMLGEVLHRTALKVRGPTDSVMRHVAAFIIDPFGGANHALLDLEEVDDTVQLYARFDGGAAVAAVIDRDTNALIARSPLQARVAVTLGYGLPWDPLARFDTPFSSFELRADLSFPRDVYGNLFIRGVVEGLRIGDGHDSHLRGVWGLFGMYDYSAPAIIRASALGLGPGVMVQWAGDGDAFLQLSAALGLSPYATAGQIQVPADVTRDYHVGPALQSFVGLAVGHRRRVMVEIHGRNWLVAGVYTPDRTYESITFMTTAVTVRLWRWLGLSAEATLASRRAGVPEDPTSAVHDTGLALRLTLCVMSDESFGTVPRPPKVPDAS